MVIVMVKRGNVLKIILFTEEHLVKGESGLVIDGLGGHRVLRFGGRKPQMNERNEKRDIHHCLHLN